MKKLLTLLLILIGHVTMAQTETLATDENGKYVIYQVDDMPGVNASVLYQRVLTGLTKNYKGKNFKMQAQPDSAISVKGSLMMYTSQSTVRHEDGDMAYQMRIEFKNGKYRYWFSNFVFAPYQRNRYGTFELAPGKSQPLEYAKAKMGEKRFNEYADQLFKYCKQLGQNLKIYAAGTPKSIENERKIDTRKW